MDKIHGSCDLHIHQLALLNFESLLEFFGVLIRLCELHHHILRNLPLIHLKIENLHEIQIALDFNPQPQREFGCLAPTFPKLQGVRETSIPGVYSSPYPLSYEGSHDRDVPKFIRGFIPSLQNFQG